MEADALRGGGGGPVSTSGRLLPALSAPPSCRERACRQGARPTRRLLSIGLVNAADAAMGEAEGGAAEVKPPYSGVLPAQPEPAPQAASEEAAPTSAVVTTPTSAAATPSTAPPLPGPLPPPAPLPAPPVPVVWSPEVEVCLFHAMLGHKPVGE